MGACDEYLVGLLWAHDGQAGFTFSKPYFCHIFDLLLFGRREDGCLGYKKKNMRGKEKTHLPSILKTSSFMLYAGRHYLSEEPPGPP